MLKAVQFGQNSGLRVSELALGTMGFGEPGRGHQGDWTLGYDETRPIIEKALESGLFYFDSADVYGLGTSEALVGKILRDRKSTRLNSITELNLVCRLLLEKNFFNDTATTEIYT